jgi:hypothetical protein
VYHSCAAARGCVRMCVPRRPTAPRSSEACCTARHTHPARDASALERRSSSGLVLGLIGLYSPQDFPQLSCDGRYAPAILVPGRAGLNHILYEVLLGIICRVGSWVLSCRLGQSTASAGEPSVINSRGALRTSMDAAGSQQPVSEADKPAAGPLRGPARRLAFAKLLHTRLCGPGHPLDNLLSADVASLVGSCMQVVYTSKHTTTGEEGVGHGDPDDCGIGWGATSAYCTSELLTGEVSRLRITCEGSDQGWGNTGHSRIEVALLRGGDLGAGCWRHHPLATMTHQRTEFTLECRAAAGEGEQEDQESAAITMPRSLCTEARPGDRYALVMVSAPYPGFQCKCFCATIEADVYC